MEKQTVGIYKDDKSGEYVVVAIAYNPTTGEAKVSEELFRNPYRPEMIERFKIAISERDLVG